MRKLASILAERARLDADDRDPRSRTDAKRDRREVEDGLADLGKQLVELSEKRLRVLELPEPLFAAIRDAQLMTSPAARNRQIRIVRRVLRQIDWQELRERTQEVVQHGAPPKPRSAEAAPEAPVDAAKAWSDRLSSRSAEELDQFISSQPHCDRSELLQLLRNLERGQGAGKAKAEAKLLAFVRDVLGQ